MAHKIRLLGMGGTVQQGMVEKVLVPKYTLDEVLDFVFKDQRKNFNIESIELVQKHNVDSNNINESDFYRLANEVYKAALDDSIDGILVTIGTDRLADIASLLEFSVRPLNKPVVFTGGMYTIEEGDTDVSTNIRKSIKLIEEIISQDLLKKEMMYNSTLIVMGDYAIYAHSSLKIKTTDSGSFVCSANKHFANFKDGISDIKKVIVPRKNSYPPKMYFPKFGTIKVENIQFGYKIGINGLTESEAIIYVGTGDGNFPRDLVSTMEAISYYYHKPQFICSNVPIRNLISNYEVGIVPEGVIQSALPVHSTYSKLAVILGEANFSDQKQKQEFILESFKKDFANETLHILGEINK